MNENLENRVHNMRISKGITQEKLGKEVGVTRQTIIAIEKGNYIPSVLLALKISKFFNQPIENIFLYEK